MNNRKEVGEMLRIKRLELQVTPQEMANRLGCNRTTLVRMENGTSKIMRSKVSLVAQAYGIEPTSLAIKLGYTGFDPMLFPKMPEEIRATVEDLEYLITVARGLQTPMNLGTIFDLLKCRQPKSTPVNP